MNHLISGCFNVPDWNRTSGLSLRRRTLYPTELQRQKSCASESLAKVNMGCPTQNQQKPVTRFCL